jgi:hypothetical protein
MVKNLRFMSVMFILQEHEFAENQY